jgi:transposase
MSEVCTIGLDIAKNVFQVHGVDRNGNQLFNKKIARSGIKAFFANTPPCLVGIEACGGAHYWARELQALGHTVKLIPPHIVKPFVMRNKTDAADAQAICEVVRRPGTKFVSMKTEEQQDLTALHCIRERLIAARTSLVNQTRGLLYERGIIFSQGIPAFEKGIKEFLEMESNGGIFMDMLQEQWKEYVSLNERIKVLTERLKDMATSDATCQRLMKIPGVGPLTATAVVGKIGKAQEFKNGRQFAAFLGLTPREHSSGGKQRLLGISKRGDSYVRKLLIQGARAVCMVWNAGECVPKGDRRKLWLREITLRRGKYCASVAQANKTARILWNVLAKGEEYDAQKNGNKAETM